MTLQTYILRESISNPSLHFDIVDHLSLCKSESDHHRSCARLSAAPPGMIRFHFPLSFTLQTGGINHPLFLPHPPPSFKSVPSGFCLSDEAKTPAAFKNSANRDQSHFLRFYRAPHLKIYRHSNFCSFIIQKNM